MPRVTTNNMKMRSVNPATLETLSEIEELTPEETRAKIAKAHDTWAKWRKTPFSERARLMKNAAAELRKQKETLAKLITQEVGKTLVASHAEVEKCALVCEYYADNAEKFLSPEPVAVDGTESYVRFDSLGVILAVMPWNFPLWQVFRFAAPALMAGNTGVLKHASNVQGSARAIEKIFTAAGFPEGCFINLAISSGSVAAVIENPFIKAITLTGSEKAGASVASIAGKEIKKTVLELGGSDPFIVFADANMEKAVKTALSARMQLNAGQSCISAKRFIVHKSIASVFAEKLAAQVAALRVGDPMLPETDVGPLTNEQMVHDVERQVTESVAKGAKILAGGKRPPGAGYFYLPTVLSGVTKGMPVYDEEVFGPVLPVITFKTEADALRITNDSPYGLGATIFRSDIIAAKKLAEHIESGCVFINSQVKSDPRLPFGGIKKSGYGRELSSYGIREFVNIKTVSVSL
jgi:succinate-semialdehyde dehydrogenase / glutarate-semialdehyde dehydrogenase